MRSARGSGRSTSSSRCSGAKPYNVLMPDNGDQLDTKKNKRGISLATTYQAFLKRYQYIVAELSMNMPIL
jgi:hypothetical protein